MTINIKGYLEEKKELIDRELKKYLPPKEKYPEKIHESMYYSVFAGGKRLRPILTLSTAELFSDDIDDVLPFACAIEFIHTYSLIHDDLPALDNDDLRRGKPTNHKVFGESNAILAGDALLNRAYEVMLEQGYEGKLSAETYLEAAKVLSTAVGTNGMIGGQVVDVEMEGKWVDEEVLLYIHKNKTAALLTASVEVGAILSGASRENINKLSNFAEYVGLGFQIIDDILDVIGDEKKLGKKIGQDEEINKATYPKIFGLEKSKKEAEKMLNKALRELDIYSERADRLRGIADFLINRDF